MEPESGARKFRFPKFNILPTVLVILALIGAGFGGYEYYQKEKHYEDPQKVVSEQQRRLIAKVGKLIELPQGEDPTVATIRDKEKLKEQAFFARAENEDKVLIYTQAKRVILYRPSTDKVIEVAPLNIGDAAGQTAGISTDNQEPQNVKIVFYNGTNESGLSTSAESDLKSKLPNVTFEVVYKAAARKKDYTKTVVVDLPGSKGDVANQIAQALNGEVGNLPDGETKPNNTEIVVILGSG